MFGTIVSIPVLQGGNKDGGKSHSRLEEEIRLEPIQSVLRAHILKWPLCYKYILFKCLVSILGCCFWTSKHRTHFRGAWGAQLVKQMALDFGSDHDFMGLGIEPCVLLCADSMEPSWDPLLSLPFPSLCSFSLSLNKPIKKSYRKHLKNPKPSGVRVPVSAVWPWCCIRPWGGLLCGQCSLWSWRPSLVSVVLRC